MSAKHTPGPWTVYDPEMPDTEATYGIDGPSGQPVVYFGLTPNDGINRLEDARLIAAAPELLMALKELLGPYVDKPSETTGMMDLLVCGEDIDAARAAIAKATGEAK